jgi:hypothetical protein
MASASAAVPSGFGASKGTNSNGWLNGLGASQGAPIGKTLPANPGGSPAPVNGGKQPGNDTVPTAPNNQAPETPDMPPEAQKPFMVIRAISAGQLPGVIVTKDAPKIKSGLTPEYLHKVGVGLYKPASSKDIALVAFNRQRIPLSTVQKLDKAGKLNSAFPSMTDLLGSNSDAEDSDEGGDEPASSGPSGNDTPVANPLNLTTANPDTPPPVPVLPKPTFGSSAQRQQAGARLKALSGSPVPGAQNNLWRAPV